MTNWRLKRNLSQEDLDQAMAREVPAPVGMATKIEDFVNEVNITLKASFQQMHEEASVRVREHIKLRTQANQTTQMWIRSGLNQVMVDHCPFCGQDLSVAALRLLQIIESSSTKLSTV